MLDEDALEPFICFEPGAVAAADGLPMAALICPEFGPLAAGDEGRQELVEAIVDHVSCWPGLRRP